MDQVWTLWTQFVGRYSHVPLSNWNNYYTNSGQRENLTTSYWAQMVGSYSRWSTKLQAIYPVCSRSCKLRTELHKLSHQIRQHRHGSAGLKLSHVLVFPNILNSYIVWCGSSASRAALKAVHRRALIRATGAFSSTSTASLEVLTNIAQLDLQLNETLLLQFYAALGSSIQARTGWSQMSWQTSQRKRQPMQHYSLT